MGYVAYSRSRTETRLCLAADALEREHHGRPLDERHPSGRLAAALERSGAEELALARTQPPPSEGTRRALEGLRRQREKALETAEQRLAASQETRRGLGRLGHRRQRAELQAEVARQRTAIHLAREQLASMPLEPPKPRLAPTPRPRLEPAQPILGRAGELDRSFGLDL